jgi:hypothetical protein
VYVWVYRCISIHGNMRLYINQTRKRLI